MMVIAYHVIWTAYGFWLPNDPRGSWSSFVGSWELFRFGPATKVNIRSSLASVPHDRAIRVQAQKELKYPPVRFSGRQALAVAEGLKTAQAEHGYCFYACSIMPDHVHLVVARCDRKIEKIVQHLKMKASQRLREEELHPMRRYADNDGRFPTIWTEKCWKCFLNDEESVFHAIRYVQDNPVREGFPPQRWSFVESYL